MGIAFFVCPPLGCVQLFVTSWTAALQASLSFAVSRSLLKLMPIELVMPSSHLVLCRPCLLPPSIFPSMGAQSLSHVQLFATPWTVACQALLSMGFSRQEDWSWLPFPSLGDLPNPGTEPTSLMSPALAGGFFTTSTT